MAKSVKWLLICATLASCRGPNSAYRVRAATDGPRAADTMGDAHLLDLPPAPDLADGPEPVDRTMPADRTADAPVADAATEPMPPSPDLPPDLRPDLPADLPPEGPGTALPAPVGFWRLDSAPGNSTPDDLGRNAGMLVNGAAITPMAATLMFDNPGALALDGNDDYVSLGVRGLPALNRPKSISVWFWTDQDAGSMLRKTVVSFENLGAGISIHLGLEYGAVAVWTWASASARIVSRQKASLTQWHHIGYSSDGQTHTLYADGAQLGTATFTLNGVSVGELFLGTYHPTDEPGERFRGRIDDVRIYDRALTAAEMATLAQGRW